ncbi:MAG: BolA family transcriptional regulator [Solirubrobacterales bacterium]|jgi:stress-induced morphogen|nr:BolA family transcriptional regulator [Solirubrobacterales bacterium]
MPHADELKARIESALPGASAEVEDWTGGGDHFRATVVAPQFAGLSRIAQHKLVYGVFGAEIGGPIHALALTTKPTE